MSDHSQNLCDGNLNVLLFRPFYSIYVNHALGHQCQVHCPNTYLNQHNSFVQFIIHLLQNNIQHMDIFESYQTDYRTFGAKDY